MKKKVDRKVKAMEREKTKKQDILEKAEEIREKKGKWTLGDQITSVKAEIYKVSEEVIAQKSVADQAKESAEKLFFNQNLAAELAEVVLNGAVCSTEECQEKAEVILPWVIIMKIMEKDKTVVFPERVGFQTKVAHIHPEAFHSNFMFCQTCGQIAAQELKKLFEAGKLGEYEANGRVHRLLVVVKFWAGLRSGFLADEVSKNLDKAKRELARSENSLAYLRTKLKELETRQATEEKRVKLEAEKREKLTAKVAENFNKMAGMFS